MTLMRNHNESNNAPEQEEGGGGGAYSTHQYCVQVKR